MDNIKLKRKVTLKRKGGEVNTPQSKSKWWLWLLLLALVVVGIVFLVKNSSSTDGKIEPPIAAQTEKTQVKDSAKAVIASNATTVTKGSATPANSGESKTSQGDAKPSNETTEGSIQNNQTVAKPITNNTSSFQNGTVDEKARRVIRGDFGNGSERKQALGGEYEVIQQRVNEMYRDQEIK